MRTSLPARNRRFQASREKAGPRRPEPVSELFWIGPTRAAARRVAGAVDDGAIPGRRRPVSLSEFARSSARPPAVAVLCPPGRGVAQDIAFLRAVRHRALWPAPPWLLQDAVAGLLNLPESDSPGRGAPSAEPAAATLLEGPVTSLRAARVLAAGGPRLWILEDPRQARWSARRIAQLLRSGVRLCALSPVRVVAVAVSRELAAAQRRWRHLVPPETRVVIVR